MPEPKNRAKNRPPKHEHPSVGCWRRHGCRCEEGSTERHVGWDACRVASNEWAKEHRKKTTVVRKASDTRRKTARLSEDELVKLRRAVGLI